MFVYILASKTRQLYVGVTNDLVRRVWEHRTGAVPGFTRRYGINRLVYYEAIIEPAQAITREKRMKGWLRCKKIALIESGNPGWADLSDEWLSARDSADPLRSLP